MKTKLFAVLSFALIINQLQANNLPQSAVVRTQNVAQAAFDQAGGDPLDIKVVVSQKRIWFVADEMPMKCLKTKVLNADGKVMLEKCFTSKCSEWFLNIEELPKGEYTLHMGNDRVEKFKK